MPRTLKKGLRDLAVFVATGAALYVVEHVGDFGIPEAYLPIAAAAAMALYRFIRGIVATDPPV